MKNKKIFYLRAIILGFILTNLTIFFGFGTGWHVFRGLPFPFYEMPWEGVGRPRAHFIWSNYFIDLLIWIILVLGMTYGARILIRKLRRK